MFAKISVVLLLLALSAAQPSGYGAPMVSYQPMTYAPSYAAPSYEVNDVTKIVDYDYAVNDYYGNVQSRQEHVEPGKQVGSSTTQLADGGVETVTYEAGAYGNLAHVVVRSGTYSAPVQSYATPVQTYSAPVQSYAAPIQTYSAPVQSYAAPVQTYSAPVQSYVAPVQSYAAPVQSYAAPVQTYAAPTYSAPTYVAPKMHYNYEENNIYVPQTYAAPVHTYAAPHTYAPMATY